jgi:hypothetical protein
MRSALQLLGRFAIILGIGSGLTRIWAAEYLSNLDNPWIDPGNPTCHCSIGDIHGLISGYDPYQVQFFTGARSVETDVPGLHTVETVAIGTNLVSVTGFELNSVTFEFIYGHDQPWSNANVKIYQGIADQRQLLGQLGNPAVNPKPTQWPESVNPRFCTTHVDYFPLTEIILQPSSEYSLVLTEAGSPSLGLLFSLSSDFVTTTDWRMGVTTTHNPWAAGEFLKVGIDATAILKTNSPNVALSSVSLSTARVGNEIVLSWPTSAPACRLCRLPGLQATTWLSVSTQPVVTNDAYVVTLPISGESCLFRLEAR